MRHVFKLVILSLAVTTACVTSPDATSETVSTSTQASDLEASDGTALALGNEDGPAQVPAVGSAGATSQSVTCSQYWGCDPVCPAFGYTNTIHEICFENGSTISDQIISVRHCTEDCF